MSIEDDIEQLRQCATHEARDEAFARLMVERAQLYENLRNTQGRCTTLLEESRDRRRASAEVTAVAKEVIAHKSRSYVAAAELLAKWILSEER